MTLRLGLIGAGGIANSYVGLRNVGDVARFVAIADVDGARAAALAESAIARSFTDYEAIPLDDIDAVVVATPPASHFDACNYFIDHGIPVLCEKPLATDASTARKLVEHAAEVGVLLTMASKFRYCADVVRAKSIVASGILGEIILFECAFTSRVSMAERWNSDPEIAGGGVIIDNGTHAVDIVRYFCGPITDVQAVEAKRIQGLRVEDTGQLILRTDQDVVATVDLSWSVNKELDSFINIYGSHGTVRVGWRQSEYHQTSSPEWVQFGSGYDKEQAMGGALANFCRAVRGEEALITRPEDAIASVEVIEAAYASLAQSTWVPVGGGA